METNVNADIAQIYAGTDVVTKLGFVQLIIGDIYFFTVHFKFFSEQESALYPGV